MTDIGPHVARAAHFVGGGSTEQRLITAAGMPGAPQWFAQIANGVRDLDVDTLHSVSPVDLPLLDQAGPRLEDLRGRLRPTARLLSIFASEQEVRLEEAVRTGKLIRVVVQSGSGGAFCFSVVPQRHVVAMQLGLEPAGRAERIRTADELMSGLATRLRADVSLPDQNPGGFAEPRRRPGPPTPTLHVTEHIPGNSTEDSQGTTTHRRVADLRAAADPVRLHWAGLVERGRLVATADHLGSPDLVEYFSLITPEARRKFYGEFASDTPNLMSWLGRAVQQVLPGPAQSLILDVEQGAIAVYRLAVRDYLVGVTLDQEQVAAMEDTLALIVAEHSVGGGAEQ